MWIENHTHSILYSSDRASKNPLTLLVAQIAKGSTISMSQLAQKMSCQENPSTNTPYRPVHHAILIFPLNKPYSKSFSFNQETKGSQKLKKTLKETKNPMLLLLLTHSNMKIQMITGQSPMLQQIQLSYLNPNIKSSKPQPPLRNLNGTSNFQLLSEKKNADI